MLDKIYKVCKKLENFCDRLNSVELEIQIYNDVLTHPEYNDFKDRVAFGSNLPPSIRKILDKMDPNLRTLDDSARYISKQTALIVKKYGVDPASIDMDTVVDMIITEYRGRKRHGRKEVLTEEQIYGKLTGNPLP